MKTKNIFDLIDVSDKIAFKVIGDGEISYFELLNLIRVRSGEFTENAIVGLCYPTSIKLIVDYLAAIYAGAIPVMIAHPSIKVKDEIFNQRLQNIKQLGVDKIYTSAFPSRLYDDFPGRQINRIAFGQLSSGTTGQQKAFLFSHDSLIKQIESYSKSISFSDKSVCVSWLPLYHDMGLIASLFLPLLQNATSVIIPTFDWINNIFMFFDVLEQEKGTHVWFPNFCFELLARKKRQICTDTMFINCSEPCKRESVDKFTLSTGIGKIYSCYAMAETVFACCQHTEKPVSLNGIMSSGKPIDGMQIKLNDNNEIEVKSDFLFSETLENGTRIKNTEEWYNTKDKGEIWDGDLYIFGRTKEMMIVNGKNVFCNEVEFVVNSVEGVDPGRCVCLPVEESGTEKCIIMFEGNKAVSTDIKEKVFQFIDINSIVMNVPQNTLIKTSSGKFSRSENSKIFHKRNKIYDIIVKFLIENDLSNYAFLYMRLRSSGILDSFNTFFLLSTIAEEFKNINWNKNYSHLDTVEDFINEFAA